MMATSARGQPWPTASKLGHIFLWFVRFATSARGHPRPMACNLGYGLQRRHVANRRQPHPSSATFYAANRGPLHPSQAHPARPHFVTMADRGCGRGEPLQARPYFALYGLQRLVLRFEFQETATRYWRYGLYCVRRLPNTCMICDPAFDDSHSAI